MTPLFDPSKITFVKEGHEYYVEADGTTQKIQSLSVLLKRTGLAPEYSKDIPDFVLEKARIRGESVHKAVQNHLQGKPWEVEEAHLSYVTNAQRLLEKHRMKAVMVETPLFNPVFDYCCTPDFVGTVDGKPAIVDWKTTAKIASATGFQLAGQVLCFRHPEEFELYIGDLKTGLLSKTPQKERFVKIAMNAFWSQTDAQDLLEELAV